MERRKDRGRQEVGRGDGEEAGGKDIENESEGGVSRRM